MKPGDIIPMSSLGMNPNDLVGQFRPVTHHGTVYLSGPIAGLTYKEARYGWRQTFINGLAPGIVGLSPMRHEGHLAEVRGALEPAGQIDHFFSGSRIIVEKDRLDIERSDIVLVNLLGATKVSIGTVAEIGMATVLGKKIVLVMEDKGTFPVPTSEYEPDKENPGRVKFIREYTEYRDNIHEHPFVTEVASLRLNNLDDAIYAVNSLLSEGL